jgi:hypothetical protein
MYLPLYCPLVPVVPPALSPLAGVVVVVGVNVLVNSV